MADPVPYDQLATSYDAWCASTPVTRDNQQFYVDVLSDAEGLAVELGVGNGRITTAVARRGKPILGVDSSTAMLELCRRRAEAAGVADLVTLVHADFRDFTLPEPAGLITIPFHSIGHLISDSDKRTGLSRVFSQLRPGGVLVFDHFVFDPDFPHQPGVARLRGNFVDELSGQRTVLWEVSARDYERQVLELLIWTDQLDESGVCVERRYTTIELSWMSPGYSRQLLTEAGFEIEELYGDFEGARFDVSSNHQVWIARRPD